MKGPAGDLAIKKIVSGSDADEKSLVMKKQGSSSSDGHPIDVLPWDGQLQDESDFSVTRQWRAELLVMATLALPCMISHAAMQGMNLTSQIFIGRIGVDELAASALAHAWINLLWGLFRGSTTALETKASQAYGARNFTGLLTVTYSSFLINTVLAIPVLVGMFFAGDVSAVVFKQGYNSVSSLVQLYCRAQIPGLLPKVWTLILAKFFQTQNDMVTPAVATVIGAALNVVLNFPFVKWLGFVGIAWADTVARIAKFLIILAASWYQQRKALRRSGLTWTQWRQVSRDAWDLGSNLLVLGAHTKLAAAGIVMTVFDVAATDVSTVLAGRISTAATAAHYALLSFTEFFCMSITVAVAMAGTVRCGNLLGAGRPRQARFAGVLCIAIGGSLTAVVGVIMAATQGMVVKAITSDAEVLKLVRRIILVAALYEIFDGFLGTIQGVLQGLGRQLHCVVYNALGLWGGGILVGWALAFKANLDLLGIWLGLLCGAGSTALLSAAGLLMINWKKAAYEAVSSCRHLDSSDEDSPHTSRAGSKTKVIDFESPDRAGSPALMLNQAGFFISPPPDTPLQMSSLLDNHTPGQSHGK